MYHQQGGYVLVAFLNAYEGRRRLPVLYIPVLIIKRSNGVDLMVPDILRQFRNGWPGDQQMSGQWKVIQTLQPIHNAHRQQRVPAQIKIVGVDIDIVPPQGLTPDFTDGFFHCIAGWIRCKHIAVFWCCDIS